MFSLFLATSARTPILLLFGNTERMDFIRPDTKPPTDFNRFTLALHHLIITVIW